MNGEDEVIKTICEKAKISEDELTRMIDDKELEFSGMVSRLGAAYIVGKELGVDLVKPMDKSLKIKNIVPEMRNVNFIGKIVNISPVREFETERGAGKVVNITLGDETGTIRMSLWNEKTDVVDKLKDGEVLEVLGGYSKKDYRGNPEVRLNKHGNLRKVEDCEIEVVETKPQSTENNYSELHIDQLSEGAFARIKAHLLQVFERRMVYDMCPSCRQRLTDGKCKEHGAVEPEKLLIVSGVIDDGYGTMNVVFFRDAAEFVLKKSAQEVDKDVRSMGEKGFFDSLDVLGTYLNIRGVVRKNDLTGNLELVCHSVKEVNIIGEINSLLAKMKDTEELVSA